MFSQLKNKILLKIHKSLYKPGHYYSPIPDVNEIRENQNVIFLEQPFIRDIELNIQEQFNLLANFKAVQNRFDFTETKNTKYRYYTNNTYFIKPDGFMLFSMLQHFQPKQIIEIGSGFSSALMLDVNEKYLANNINLTFIEPYPDRLYSLVDKNKQQNNILEKKVQEVSLELFDQLEENDILFIDSSHMSKVGSDVNHIFFNIFPRLKPGVIIHIHDITWPLEYPKQWIFEGRFWNEAYLLRAFLMNNDAYEIMVFNNYLSQVHGKWLKDNLPLAMGGGGSFYMKKMK